MCTGKPSTTCLFSAVNSTSNAQVSTAPHPARQEWLDTYGRLVAIDALDSDYGPNWRRVNSLLTHRPDGSWCYLFANHGRGSGRDAKQYAITANGRGVTPVIRAYVDPPA